VDYSPANVEFCQRRHKAPNLRFTVGDAEALPFPDESFDAVLNIESAHCYPDIDRFFAEVVRVLRPGGHLLFADEWWTQQLPELLNRICRPGLRILAEQDLTPGVIEALRRLQARAEVLLAELPEGPSRLQYERFFMERVCRESATSYTSGRFVFHSVLAVRDQT
jgi:ubiquinone/menaquinone biosynthesis C-methylase UbiE